MNLLCKIFGHKETESELKRSRFTVYTHWQDITCKRCGKYLWEKLHYIDARTNPEMFKDDYK